MKSLKTFIIACAAAAGCIGQPQNPAATQPATVVSAATTQPSYWIDQPGVVAVQARDFQKLWNAAEEVARDFFFRIDRADYRTGLLTTQPMVSAQWFEPWRPDAVTIFDRTESALASIRRTIRFEFEQLPDESFQVTPKVLVERQALTEQRITSVVLYRSAFTRTVRAGDRSIGTRESDIGLYLPYRYWYPIDRDEALEQRLAGAIRKKLRP